MSHEMNNPPSPTSTERKALAERLPTNDAKAEVADIMRLGNLVKRIREKSGDDAYKLTVHKAVLEMMGGWRCFYCNSFFTTKDDAAAHFGRDQKEPPKCIETAERIPDPVVGKGSEMEQPRIADCGHKPEQQPHAPSLKTDPELLALIERAKSHVMTPEEQYEQRRSFVRGMCPNKYSYDDWCAQVDKMLPPLNAETRPIDSAGEKK